jgi:hypothetical protein
MQVGAIASSKLKSKGDRNPGSPYLNLLPSLGSAIAPKSNQLLGRHRWKLFHGMIEFGFIIPFPPRAHRVAVT